MGLVPKSFVQRQWLDALKRIRYGTISFVGPAGEQWQFSGPEPGPDAHFRIHEWNVIQRLVARGDIGLGEDYIAGAWESEKLEDLIAFFLLNLEELEGFAHGNLVHRQFFALYNTIVRRNSLSGSRRNIEAHYDVGNDFYALWLDETMTYSSALYQGPERSLSAAQRNKYDRLLSKIDDKKASILEIGCGWGGFAERAVQSGHDVTGLTISPAQHAFATRRLAGNADIRLQDYRNVRGTFDAIVSIEMVEAVGELYWPVYFQTLADRLKDGGKAILQAIVIRDELFNGYRTRSDFIRHYVFPGGLLPSVARLREEAGRVGLKLRECFEFGQDYATTLRQWGNRMDAREQEIRALGYDDKMLRNWHYYLGICAAAFSIGRTNVAHLEFVRR